jgi:ATP-dependent exoDNAse (exonuclease V) alpha subunit
MYNFTAMENAEFELAVQFALYTRKHCFITGKAGTGKTTLLKRIVERTQKNVVVVAPTGVAAINAGGVTIHSMFGLPLTCFVPNDDFVDLNLATNRRRMLHEHIHFRKDKLRVLREMEMLIIDEVSMVRCDMLDVIDFVLRTVRRNNQPFGDVQILLFGDMHQLPPVVKEAEWGILKSYYRSPYFFDSLVWPQLQAAEIELQKIYRQSDRRFLTLLNNIRNFKMDADDYERLRERYNANFNATEKGYILLATHNSKADGINASELAKLPGLAFSFEAQIEGDFPETMFPCDRTLHLKAGAQVMFIRNDTEDGRYYNGKLAVVKQIERDNITVTFNEDRKDYALHREIWENINYSLEEESGRVVKQELGTFSQFPLRLAWAITIHKSQGLTFDKIIIDAGRSFAAGQVYVALSRCRSLEGIVLHSLIPSTALVNDRRIGEFSAAHHPTGELQDLFVLEKNRYANHLLLRLFTFDNLAAPLEEWQDLIAAKDIPDKDAAAALHAQVWARVCEINATAGKFQLQLQRILAVMKTDPDQIATLKERCDKAIRYFTDQIALILTPLRTHVNGLAYKKKVKRYLQHIQSIEEICWSTIDRLYQGRFLDEKLYTGEWTHTKDKFIQVVSSATRSKKGKGGTFKDTLDLHRQGKKVQEIAAIRGLTKNTIKQHIAQWIATGEIDVYDVLPAEMIEKVLAFMEEKKSVALGEIRSGLNNKFDYDDIRMIVSHALRIRNQKPSGS